MPPEIVPAQPSGPPCAACGAPSAVQWRRRSATDPESTDAVYACAAHPILIDLAAQVHQPSCTAPDPAVVPACGCTPEPLPPPEPLSAPVVTLPSGWTIQAPEGSN